MIVNLFWFSIQCVLNELVVCEQLGVVCGAREENILNFVLINMNLMFFFVVVVVAFSNFFFSQTNFDLIDAWHCVYSTWLLIVGLLH
jgi:hypothetical protein